MAELTPQQIEERTQQIRQRRIATIVGAYEMMKLGYPDIRNNTSLHHGVVAATVEHYLQERENFVSRHSINNRIQRHKVAGLMASAIVTNKPIQITNFEESSNGRISRDNEYFAVLHGLAICAEDHPERLAEMRKCPFIGEWIIDLVYLLRSSPSNSASFILIFQTLSLSYFPENLQH